MKNSILHAALQFSYKEPASELIKELTMLLSTQISFEKKINDVDYYGGESMGLRFFLEITSGSNKYELTVTSSNRATSSEADGTLDISFHFQTLLNNSKAIIWEG